MQTKQFHVIPNTLFPCLPTPAPTPRPIHHQPSSSFILKTILSSTLSYGRTFKGDSHDTVSVMMNKLWFVLQIDSGNLD